MPNPFGDNQIPGVIYNTSMSRPDAALALAALYGFEGKRESRIGSICVTGAGLGAAIFCDIVGRVYMPGPARNSNSVLPVGFSESDLQTADPPMVKSAIDRRNEKNELQYARSIRKVSDTAVPEAVLRNGVVFNAEDVMVLSAPATHLAKSLDLTGVRDIYKDRVRRLVIVDSGVPRQDAAALRRVLSEWPGPMFLCDAEVGAALPFPGASIETVFNWAPAHPVADAYTSYKPMPWNTPSWDLAAVHYAVHPNSGFFQLSEPGSLSVAADGRTHFSEDSSGRIRRLIVDQSQKEKAIQSFVELVSAKPVLPPVRQRRPAEAVPAAQQQVPPASAGSGLSGPNQNQVQK